jgi:hypothetical protein
LPATASVCHPVFLAGWIPPFDGFLVGHVLKVHAFDFIAGHARAGAIDDSEAAFAFAVNQVGGSGQIAG